MRSSLPRMGLYGLCERAEAFCRIAGRRPDRALRFLAMHVGVLHGRAFATGLYRRTFCELFALRQISGFRPG